MRSPVGVILAAAITLSCPLGSSQTRPALSISLRAVQPVVKAGDEVSVEIRLTNNLSYDINTSANISDLVGVDPNYIFDVHDRSGKPVPKRKYKHSEFAVGRAIFEVVKSGETITLIQPLSRLYDMSGPGEYTVQVGRCVSDNPKEAVMKSNKITVTVTP